jgi:carbon monoxide dehydrogenase subunit G
MKIEGTRDFPAPRQQIWATLMDPEVLRRCLPGCEKLEPEGDNRYRAEIKVGLASVKGAYTGSVRISDVDEPNSFRLAVEGKGSTGFVRGSAELALSEAAGGTSLRYSGDLQVGGLIAAIGQRMLQGMASTLVNTFFQCLEREVSGRSA